MTVTDRQTEDRQIDRRADVVLCRLMSYGTLHRCENMKFCTFRIVLHISFTLQADSLLQKPVAPHHRTPQPGTSRASANYGCPGSFSFTA